jgi:hypothetical protein
MKVHIINEHKNHNSQKVHLVIICDKIHYRKKRTIKKQ